MNAEDAIELRLLADRYADAVDRRDGAALRALFGEGGRLLVQADGGPVEGEWVGGDIAGMLGTLGGYEATLHHVGGCVWEEGGTPGRITGRVRCVAHHYERTRSGPVDLVMMIVYHDDYEKVEGTWLIAERRVAVGWRELHPALPVRPSR